MVRMGTGEGKREGDEREISKEEIKEVVLKLREEKAMGGDGISHRLRRNMQEGVERRRMAQRVKRRANCANSKEGGG